MRRIAQFNSENHALRFWNFLKKQGIESSFEKNELEDQETSEVWVEDEDQSCPCKLLLEGVSGQPRRLKVFWGAQKRNYKRTQYFV